MDSVLKMFAIMINYNNDDGIKVSSIRETQQVIYPSEIV